MSRHILCDQFFIFILINTFSFINIPISHILNIFLPYSFQFKIFLMILGAIFVIWIHQVSFNWFFLFFFLWRLYLYPSIFSSIFIGVRLKNYFVFSIAMVIVIKKSSKGRTWAKRDWGLCDCDLNSSSIF